MENFNIDNDIDSILDGDESIDDIIEKAIGESTKKVSTGGSGTEKKEERNINYDNFALEDSIVLSLDDAKKIIQLAKSIPNFNDLANFIGFKVMGDKVRILVTNVSEYLSSDFVIRNSKNRMPEGEFMALPVDTIIKSARSSRDAITIFKVKESSQYRVSVIGGSIPIENNSSVRYEDYDTLKIDESAEKTMLDISEYKDVVSSLAGLANSAVSVQQKTIVWEDGYAKTAFIRCFSRKRVSNPINIVMRVTDLAIIARLLDRTTGKGMAVYKNDNRRTYVIGNSVYSCMETSSFIQKHSEELLEETLNKGCRVEVNLDDIKKLTSLMVSLKNVDSNLTMKLTDKHLIIQTNMNGEENTFEIDAVYKNNKKFSGEIKLDTTILNNLVSNYSGERVSVVIDEEALVIDTAEKISSIGAEII